MGTFSREDRENVLHNQPPEMLSMLLAMSTLPQYRYSINLRIVDFPELHILIGIFSNLVVRS
jgi:hypothetical protein